MPRDWTTISLYLDKSKYRYYSKLAEMRGQSRNSLLIQLIDWAIIGHNDAGTLFSDWDSDDNEDTTTDNEAD
jgi:hypothetical protein